MILNITENRIAGNERGYASEVLATGVMMEIAERCAELGWEYRILDTKAKTQQSA